MVVRLRQVQPDNGGSDKESSSLLLMCKSRCWNKLRLTTTLTTDYNQAVNAKEESRLVQRPDSALSPESWYNQRRQRKHSASPYPT